MIKKLCLITIALFALTLSGYSQDSDHAGSAIGQKVAEAYGFDGFDKIEQLKYTFNAQIEDKTVSRSWIWMPQKNQVIYLGDNQDSEPFTYNRDIVSKGSDAIKEVDSKFINDQYWLVFPFHLVWDEGIRIEVEDEKVDLPLGSGMSTKISVIYPDTGGYTPGDIYELYLDENYMITKWIYRRGGSDTPTRISSWEDNTQFGPITISLNHQGPDSNFRVWFTNVEIKLLNPEDE